MRKRRLSSMRFAVAGIAGVFLLMVISANSDAETWRGLTVAPENRCSPYRSKDYRYPQSVEPKIVRSIGKMYSPYSGECFTSLRQSDIEHIVARSEAHDSGLCAASGDLKRRFSSDLLNLTLASPYLNRQLKSHYDAAEWIPNRNQCWFADTVVAVKRKYQLTVDRREAQALENILSRCESIKMVVTQCVSVVQNQSNQSVSTGELDSNHPLSKWDDNKNGRITCKEARRHGIAPVYSDHPAYKYMRDGNNDGVICK